MSKRVSPKMEYDLKSVKLPHISGLLLRFFVILLESPLRGLLTPILFRNAGITWLRKQQISEPPTLCPITYHATLSSRTEGIPKDELSFTSYGVYLALWWAIVDLNH